MSRTKANKGAKPRRIVGAALLFLIAAGIFIYFAKQRQVADLADHPVLTHYVQAESDLIGRGDAAALEDELAKLDKSGAAQAIVVANERLSTATIADEALQIARRYRLGHAGKNDGLVLLIDAQDKKARIEVGYGLEGMLTDAQARLIIANDIEPFLSKGDIGAAARHGIDAILAVVHPAPFAEPAPEKLGTGWRLGVGLFMVVIALVVLGVVQGLVLAIPGMNGRITASKRWGWFARVRILGGQSRNGERASSSSSSASIGGGGSFGGGGAND
jgi:uncharacterized protein